MVFGLGGEGRMARRMKDLAINKIIHSKEDDLELN